MRFAVSERSRSWCIRLSLSRMDDLRPYHLFTNFMMIKVSNHRAQVVTIRQRKDVLSRRKRRGNRFQRRAQTRMRCRWRKGQVLLFIDKGATFPQFTFPFHALPGLHHAPEKRHDRGWRGGNHQKYFRTNHGKRPVRKNTNMHHTPSNDRAMHTPRDLRSTAPSTSSTAARPSRIDSMANLGLIS